MIKKIGILTLVSADNCGSLLQAYALLYAFRSICQVDAELINFWPPQARKLYRTFHPSVIKRPKSLWRTIYFWKALKNQSKMYEEFRYKELKLVDKKILNKGSLNKYLSNFKAVVVGSDQVWNVRMFDFDPAYFLSDCTCRKFAYAASLGGNEKEEAPAALLSFRTAIEAFDRVSVREPQGKRILDSFCMRDIEVCIDPTLIIPEKEWNRLGGNRLVNEDYVFYYSYNYSDKVLCKLVQDCAHQYKLPVYVINASRWIHHLPGDYGFHFAPLDGPKAFLSLMKHAKYVFVQSLHGAIFASVFHTNYWFLNNRETDVIDLRSENVLRLLGTRHRVLRPNNYKDMDIKAPCDYLGNEKLEEERAKSIAYLHQIVFSL
ncbi:polysaccharide pyruvyl transferase family protein [Phocaeicola faecalis]|uniref:polysaccharide pyruvyl transferase family protein n=1 Tax=Phocaeicola faecalis TaxID=2786956 RepID=UPI001F2BC65C|nr:polysaccharide pyruvyl transferase family protein [Phocaeicola faecalis]